ncbi:PIG-L family deacetylase [Halobacillus litoralis]|nr:PIG-L family deacetylase [Halobacillus litoralis]
MFPTSHPDDEILSMGSSILSHNFNPDNQDNNNLTHLVLLTGGEHSFVYDIAAGERKCYIHNKYHNPHKEGYAPFNREVFKEGKVENFKLSAAMLGVTPDRTHIYDLGNGDVSAKEVKKIIKELQAEYPNSKFKSMTYHDDHHDHANSGKALLELFNNGTVDDARFYVTASDYAKGKVKVDTFPAPYDEKWNSYLFAAAQTYEDWNPRKGFYHSGGASVPDSFRLLKKNPRNYIHTPND